MRAKPRITGMLLLMSMGLMGFGCGRSTEAVSGGLPEPQQDVNDEQGQGQQQAVFAGGCFWCVEAVFQRLDGVEQVTSGYAGGDAATADYQSVSTGQTGHAEVVQIKYDPDRISYGKLLRVFFATHDPTQLNRQGPDVGPQYRSAVFYASPQQHEAAQAYIEQLEVEGVYDKPIVTTLEPLDAFHPAEKYHQDFVDQNPDHPYVRFHALPKLEKVEQQFGDQVRE